MIDEKGRLFGKVNIVDLLIILIVLAAAAFLGYRFLGPDSNVANTEPVRLTLYCEESADYAVEQLTEGAEAWDPRTTSSSARSPIGALATPRAM